MRMIGLDVGERRIGVAVSDPEGRLAVPQTVITRKGKGDVQAIGEVIARAEAERVVVGLPVSLDGGLGPQARLTEAFAEQLRAVTTVEVVLYDERFSSAEADRHLQAAGMRAREAKQYRDATAAAIILQAYLDSLRFPPLPAIE